MIKPNIKNYIRFGYLLYVSYFIPFHTGDIGKHGYIYETLYFISMDINIKLPEIKDISERQNNYVTATIFPRDKYKHYMICKATVLY